MYFEINEDAKELTKHRSGDIPLAIYHRILQKKRGDELIYHWHDEFQLTVVLTGELTISVGKKKYHIRENDGFFINSQKLHHAIPVSEEVEYICIDFAPTFVNEEIYQTVLRPLQKNQRLSCHPITLRARQKKLLSRIIKGDINENLLQIYELLFYYLNEISEATSFNESEDNKDIYRLIDHIHQNFQKNITVAKLAQIIPINKNKCTKLFKSYTGYSPMNYVIDYRLLKAKELLLNTDQSIAEICYEVGFNNLSYFSARFKRRYGISPKCFRETFSVKRK